MPIGAKGSKTLLFSSFFTLLIVFTLFEMFTLLKLLLTVWFSTFSSVLISVFLFSSTFFLSFVVILLSIFSSVSLAGLANVNMNSAANKKTAIPIIFFFIISLLF